MAPKANPQSAPPSEGPNVQAGILIEILDFETFPKYSRLTYAKMSDPKEIRHEGYSAKFWTAAPFVQDLQAGDVGMATFRTVAASPKKHAPGESWPQFECLSSWLRLSRVDRSKLEAFWERYRYRQAQAKEAPSEGSPKREYWQSEEEFLDHWFAGAPEAREEHRKRCEDAATQKALREKAKAEEDAW